MCNLPSTTRLLQGPIPAEPDARTWKKWQNNVILHSAIVVDILQIQFTYKYSYLT